ncbi:MAG: hypothetical protein KatS3mg096_837 [Candidatus Parcubacteria bacterium]|nr:MAG: hypothetical protein KatS3mg096_837 [Candidatus Parcubacteria bacterium]
MKNNEKPDDRNRLSKETFKKILSLVLILFALATGNKFTADYNPITDKRDFEETIAGKIYD